MEVVKNFLNDYGYSFLMMVIEAFVIAILLEITVKKALSWLEGKWAGNEKLLKALDAIKTFLIQFVTWVMVVCFVNILMENMPLPGSKVFFPVWLGLLYILQYLFSCWGIKGFQSWLKRMSEKEPKEKKEKPVLTKTDYAGIYKDETGKLVDKKGNPVKF